MKQLTIKYRLNNLLFNWVRIPLLVLSVCVANSCNNYPDPSTETLVNYNVSYMNPNQTSIGGEYLNDSIYVQIYNYKSPQDISNFTVEFKVQKGGGSVDQQQVKTQKDGKAATRWKLGTDSFTQIVTAQVTDPDGNLLPEATITAHGILRNAWNEVDYSPLSTLSDLASDTIAYQSWMISASKIYKRGDNFLDWQQLNEPKLNGAREIEIDKNGVIYIGTWYGELYKSQDHGQTWIKCTKPIPDRSYYFYFWITNDGDLWATQNERGLWHSKDGGMTWLNPVNVSGVNFYMNGAYRLKNGWLLSLISPAGQKQEVMKSEDDGKTWSSLSTPENPYSIFVTENEDIIVFTQSNAGIYKSTDLGKTYKLVYSGSVTFNTGSMQSYVHKFGSYYYLTIPGYGVLKTPNFENFETIFSEPNINSLYIDHTGSVFAAGTNTKSNRVFIYNRN
jgi:photosystem II stability/assembly factor-like uncharacterized protein